MAYGYTVTLVLKIIFSIYLNINRTVSKAFVLAECDLLASQTLALTITCNQRLKGYESRYPSSQQRKSLTAPPHQQTEVFMLIYNQSFDSAPPAVCK